MRIMRLEARRVDRVEATVTLGFGGGTDWAEHVLDAKLAGPEREQMLPTALHLVWTRYRMGLKGWQIEQAVATGHKIVDGAATIDGPSTMTEVDTDGGPQWVRDLVEQHSPANPKSPLHLQGLGDLT